MGRYWDYDDAASKTIVNRPWAAFVEKVYEEGDFSSLVIA